MRISEKDLNSVYNKLEKTDKLIMYFPDGFDFGIDPYDPIIEDFYEIVGDIHEKNKKLDSLFDNESFYELLFRGSQRHITVSVRFAIYERLQSIYNKVTPKHKDLIWTATIALEDIGLNPLSIGLVLRLYSENILRVALFNRINIEDSKDKENLTSLQAFIDEIRINPSEELIKKVTSCGSNALDAIERVIYELDEINEIKGLLSVVCRIPCHRSARIITNLLLDDFPPEDLAETVRDIDLMPFVSAYLFNELQKKDTDYLDRWVIYELLVRVGEYTVFEYLRDELINTGKWLFNPQMNDPDEADIAFYSDVARYLIILNDRRAVPVFIRFLNDSAKTGFSERIIEEVKDMVFSSKWSDEIKRGLALFQEGELVFVDDDERPLQKLGAMIDGDIKEINKFGDLLEKKAETIEDLNRIAAEKARRWNEAYHRALNGLRPVDIPEPAIKIVLMQRMVRDFEKNARKDISPDELVEAFNEFQKEFMITPLPENGEIPIVMLMREVEKLHTTNDLKQHLEKYKTDTINSLYTEASLLYENGDTEGVRKRLDAILSIAPDYPFAKGLKRRALWQRN